MSGALARAARVSETERPRVGARVDVERGDSLRVSAYPNIMRPFQPEAAVTGVGKSALPWISEKSVAKEMRRCADQRNRRQLRRLLLILEYGEGFRPSETVRRDGTYGRPAGLRSRTAGRTWRTLYSELVSQ